MEAFERVFTAVHGETLSYERGAIGRVQRRIAELYPNSPSSLVRTFARGRVFLRIKFLNFLRHEEEAAERVKKKAAKAAAAAAKAAEAGLQPGLSKRARARASAPAATVRRNIKQAKQLAKK